jgi:putative flippase GtrA
MQRISIGGSSAVRYCLIGIVNTLIYSTLLYLFLEVVSVTPGVAVSLAYLIAISFHFWMNRIYVFRASDGRIAGQLFRYLIFVISSYLVSLALVSICVRYLHLPSLVVVSANLVATMLLGYALSSLWVFR